MIYDLPPHSPRTPPLTNNHFLLPLPGHKYAPRTLTTTGRQHDLAHFVDVYNHLCAHFKITDEKEKCKGVISYCTSKVARKIEKLPSYIRGDYEQLIKDLKYFMKEEEKTFSIYEVEEFTRKWRKRNVENFERFKRYHRKYLELIGQAVVDMEMSLKECDRYFWEGIHRSLQKRIDSRLSALNPDLDAATPFRMDEVVSAARYLFKRRRFDEHLSHKSKHNSSDSETEEEEYRPKHISSDSEEEKENDSDDSDVPKKRQSGKKPHHTNHKSSLKKESSPRRKSVDKEISEMSEQLRQLRLYVMKNESPPNDMSAQPRNRFNRNPPNFNNPNQRDPPPHRQFNPPQGQPQDRSEYLCYGCGKTGHRMGQCHEINTLLNQGTIVRSINGRLLWPDGSNIYRDRDDNYIQAIDKVLKRSNIVHAQVPYSGEEEEEEVYQYVGISREEDDASTDEQEELGWSSGSISDRYAFGVERNPRVSKDSRRQVQQNPPNNAQGVKKFPERRNAVNTGKQGPPINYGPAFNSDQSRLPKRITPTDVNQNKFEGKHDNQFLPMEVDQVPEEKPENNATQVPPHQRRGNVVKVPNPRPRTGRSTSELVQEIMNMPLTVTVEEAVNISPPLQRDLMNASRAVREALPQTQEKKEKNEKISLGSSLSKSLIPRKGMSNLGKPRESLLTVPATIGRATMTGVFDCGSQVNVLSDRYAKVCGLPIMAEGAERYRITGVNGGLARCVGVIPNVKIYLTESELETVGELIVVKDGGFDLLLGRPWGTTNSAGLREAPEGTYLSFNSEGARYEVNASPNPSYDKSAGETDEETHTKHHKNTYRVAAASYTNETPVPDSEPERNLPQDKGSDNEDSEEEKKTGDQEQFTPTGAPYEYIEELEQEPGKLMTVEVDLQESYIRMVQKGANNEEWNLFCEAENRRLQQDKDQWEQWSEEQKLMEAPQSDGSEEENSPPDLSDRLETLATQETVPPPTQNPSRKPKEASVITASRRSRRVRKETQKAKESEEWQQMKKRAYERSEKLQHKTITSKKLITPKRVLASFGTKISTLKTDRHRATPSNNQSNQLEDYDFDHSSNQESAYINPTTTSSNAPKEPPPPCEDCREKPQQEGSNPAEIWLATGPQKPNLRNTNNSKTILG